jgi:hypothetical protein
MTDRELAKVLHVCPEAESAWVHTKTGNTYVVVACALRESDLQPVVTYRRNDGSSLVWCRPLSEWLERVTVEGVDVTRFRPLYPDNCRKCGSRRVVDFPTDLTCWRCGTERG